MPYPWQRGLRKTSLSPASVERPRFPPEDGTQGLSLASGAPTLPLGQPCASLLICGAGREARKQRNPRNFPDQA